MTEIALFPLLGPSFKRADFVEVDLSIGSPLLAGWPLGDQEQLDERIRQFVHLKKGRIGYGGYRERRRLYAASVHFGEGGSQRCVHLGVDFWTEAGQPIHAPMSGRVHSLGFNTGHLDYGATIVLEHDTKGELLYTLYGHLSHGDLEGLTVGQVVTAGAVVGHIGPPTDNGGWAPHLHFQCIRDMGDRRGDFPGVCTADEEYAYDALCPDPMAWVAFEGG